MTDDLEHKGWLAVEHLRKTDEQHANLEADAKRAKHRYDKTVDAHFLVLEGSVEIRKAKARAEAEPLFIEFIETQSKADALGNTRDTAQRTIDYIRTIMANRRMG